MYGLIFACVYRLAFVLCIVWALFVFLARSTGDGEVIPLYAAFAPFAALVFFKWILKYVIFGVPRRN